VYELEDTKKLLKRAETRYLIAEEKSLLDEDLDLPASPAKGSKEEEAKRKSEKREM